MAIDPNPKKAPPSAPAAPQQAGIAKLNVQYAPPMPQALQAVPEDVARRYNVLPLSLENNNLRVFMANTSDILTIENLSIYTRKRIEPIAASIADIKEGIDYNYRSAQDPARPGYTAVPPQAGIARSNVQAPAAMPQEGIAKSNVQASAPTPQALQAIPEDVARKYGVLPISLEDNTLSVFMANPSDIMTIENLSVYTRKNIQPIVASVADIRAGIDFHYGTSDNPPGPGGAAGVAAAADEMAARAAGGMQRWRTGSISCWTKQSKRVHPIYISSLTRPGCASATG